MTDPSPIPPPAPGISVLIMTRDEEINIGACLRGMMFSDDVVVLDDNSADGTLGIVKTFPGVRVVQRTLDNWAAQQNWALETIAFKHRWVFQIDADERMTPELRDELLAIAADPQDPRVAYYVGRKNYFMGRWLKHAMGPVKVLRFFQPPFVRYERLVNPAPVIRGPSGELRNYALHYSFSKGLVPWLSKHNSYARFEAMEGQKVRQGSGHTLRSDLRALFQGGPEHRQAVKRLSYRLPGRAVQRFAYTYLMRCGFLDGLPGLRFCLMIAMYEYWIELKLIEARHDWAAGTRACARRFMDDPPPARAPLVEVLILTLNEARHIAETVANARSVGPVFVLDSHSTDGTQELARRAGATVVEHDFAGYGPQKNWALDNLPFQGSWVFILDADERITPAVADEVRAVAQGAGPAQGYYVNRLMIFMGQPIRHGGLYPSWNLRFFRRGACRYEERSVHEHMICRGPTQRLRHRLIHIRDEDMTRYIDKHIHYADLESDEWVRGRFGPRTAPSGAPRDRVWYRRVLRRRLWPRVPLRPLCRFLYMYLFRLGFLDGRAGWHMAMLMASYEYMISLLYREKLSRLLASRGPGGT